jgi:hypothetical protein
LNIGVYRRLSAVEGLLGFRREVEPDEFAEEFFGLLVTGV